MTRSKIGWLFLESAFLLALAGGTPAVYAHGGDPTLIHSCVNKRSGGRLWLVLVLYGLISSCTPAIPLSTPPENYKGPIAERPVLHQGEYWVYKRGDLTKAKATTLTANMEFPLWVGRSWSYDGEALRRGQSQTSQAFRFPTKIDCYAAAFKEVVVAAGSFGAFECQCQCEVRNPGRYEPGCGAWTIWYAPDVKNVIKIKAERTDRSMELESYKNLSAKPEVRSTDAGVKFTDSNVTIVTARFVEKGRGVTGITDTFTFEGKIFVHITFKWDVEKEGGKHNIQAKWYSGEKLVSVGDYAATFNRSPHYVWFETAGTSLGVGKAKVEIYADGVLVGTKHFAVVSQ